MTDTATSAGRQTDRNPADSTDSAFTRVNGRPEKVADSLVGKAAALDAAAVGRKLTHALVVNNNGADGATGGVLNDPPPLRMGLSSATARRGSSEPRTGQVHGELGSIASGGEATMSIEAAPNVNGMVFTTTCGSLPAFR